MLRNSRNGRSKLAALLLWVAALPGCQDPGFLITKLNISLPDEAASTSYDGETIGIAVAPAHAPPNAIYRWSDADGLTKVAQVGDPAPDGNGSTYSLFMSAPSADQGLLSFQTAFGTMPPRTAIFTNDGSTTILEKMGSATTAVNPPKLLNGRILYLAQGSSFQALRINATNSSVFDQVALIDFHAPNPPIQSFLGYWLARNANNDEVVFYTALHTSAPLNRLHMVVGGVDTVVHAGLDGVLAVTGITGDFAYFSATSGIYSLKISTQEVTQLIRNGDATPDGKNHYFSFAALGGDLTKGLVFQAFLDVLHSEVYVLRSGKVQKIVGTGDTVDGAAVENAYVDDSSCVRGNHVVIRIKQTGLPTGIYLVDLDKSADGTPRGRGLDTGIHFVDKGRSLLSTTLFE